VPSHQVIPELLDKTTDTIYRAIIPDKDTHLVTHTEAILVSLIMDQITAKLFGNRGLQ